MSKIPEYDNKKSPKFLQQPNFDKIFNSFHTSFANQHCQLSNLQEFISKQVDSLKNCKQKCKTRLRDAVFNLRQGYRFFSQDLKNEWGQICKQFVDISTKICVVFIQQMMKIEEEKGQWKSKYFQLEEQNKEFKRYFQQINSFNEQDGPDQKSSNSNSFSQFQNKNSKIQQKDRSHLQFESSSKKVTPFSPFGEGNRKNLSKNLNRLTKQHNMHENEQIKEITEQGDDNDNQNQLITQPITQLFQENQKSRYAIGQEKQLKGFNSQLSTILKEDSGFAFSQSVEYNFKGIKAKDLKSRHHRNHSSSYNGEYSGGKQQEEKYQSSKGHVNDITNTLLIKHVSLTKKYLSRKSNRSQNNQICDKSLQRLVKTRNKSRGQWEHKKNQYGCVRSSLNRFLMERGLRTYNYRSVV